MTITFIERISRSAAARAERLARSPNLLAECAKVGCSGKLGSAVAAVALPQQLMPVLPRNHDQQRNETESYSSGNENQGGLRATKKEREPICNRGVWSDEKDNGERRCHTQGFQKRNAMASGTQL